MLTLNMEEIIYDPRFITSQQNPDLSQQRSSPQPTHLISGSDEEGLAGGLNLKQSR
jgi:hypothetical protein